MKLRFAAARLLALFRKRRLDGELEGEILAHLEMAELDAIAAGLSPEEARREARRGFGGIEQMKEDHRDQRSVRWVENLLRDVRYGMASLARDPGFAAVTIGLLALGIGANTAMFSIVDAVLLKPLPFPEPERMVRVWETPTPGRAQRHHHAHFSRLEAAGRHLRGVVGGSAHRGPRWRPAAIRRAFRASWCRPITFRCSA